VYGRIEAHQIDADATPTQKLQPQNGKSMANRAFGVANDMPGASVEQGPGAKKGGHVAVGV